MIHEALSKTSNKWINSPPIPLEQLKDRIILLDFWTYCCTNCHHILPDLKALENEFGPALTVIGIHSGKFHNERHTDMIEAAIARHGIQHPVINDADYEIWTACGVRAWPSLILLQPRGAIVDFLSGEGHRQHLQTSIRALIKKYPESTSLPEIKIYTSSKPKTKMYFPTKLAYDHDRKDIFIADSGNNRIIKRSLDGRLEKFYGTTKAGLHDGNYDDAQFSYPQGLLFHPPHTLYVCDTRNHAIRKIDFRDEKISTIISHKTKHDSERNYRKDATLVSPWDIANLDDMLIITSTGRHQLLSFDGKKLSIFAGTGDESIDDGRGDACTLAQPSALLSKGSSLYLLDAETSALRTFNEGKMETIIGTGLFVFGFEDGSADNALLQHPTGLSFTADETGLYIADTFNHAIRHYDFHTKNLSTITGHQGKQGHEDGPLDKARFSEPRDVLAIDKDTLLVADTNNHVIRSIDLKNNNVSTIESR